MLNKFPFSFSLKRFFSKTDIERRGMLSIGLAGIWSLSSCGGGGDDAAVGKILVSVFAGLVSHTSGSSDGSVETASFYQPSDIALDNHNNMYIADFANHKIRRISDIYGTPTVSTIAGSVAGYKNAQGINAKFYYPASLAYNPLDETLLVAEFGYNTIRKISLSTGAVSLFAGYPGQKGSVDGVGSVARFNGPAAIAIDTAGNSYVCDQNSHTVRKISPSGSVSTLAGIAGSAGYADGLSTTAQFNQPQGITIGQRGDVYVADTNNHILRKISPQGLVTTIAGTPTIAGYSDGDNASNLLNLPVGIDVDSNENIYFTNASLSNKAVRVLTNTGSVHTIAGPTYGTVIFSNLNGIALDSQGTIYVANTTFNQVLSINFN